MASETITIGGITIVIPPISMGDAILNRQVRNVVVGIVEQCVKLLNNVIVRELALAVQTASVAAALAASTAEEAATLAEEAAARAAALAETNEEIRLLYADVWQTAWPVDSVFVSTENVSPAGRLGFGTWQFQQTQTFGGPSSQISVHLWKRTA